MARGAVLRPTPSARPPGGNGNCAWLHMVAHRRMQDPHLGHESGPILGGCAAARGPAAVLACAVAAPTVKKGSLVESAWPGMAFAAVAARERSLVATASGATGAVSTCVCASGERVRAAATESVAPFLADATTAITGRAAGEFQGAHLGCQSPELASYCRPASGRLAAPSSAPQAG
jgi:hypothetical protein